MEERAIYISAYDKKRLMSLVAEGLRNKSTESKSLQNLKDELDRGIVVEPQDIPHDVVTMNSTVQFKDLETEEVMIYTLVFPAKADINQNKLSILAPIGTALFGYRVGSIIEWKVPNGTQRIQIEKILYQPESEGDFSL